MTMVLERVERTDAGVGALGECASCGIGRLARPTWLFCADCQRHHTVCQGCADAASEEDA